MTLKQYKECERILKAWDDPLGADDLRDYDGRFCALGVFAGGDTGVDATGRLTETGAEQLTALGLADGILGETEAGLRVACANDTARPCNRKRAVLKALREMVDA